MCDVYWVTFFRSHETSEVKDCFHNTLKKLYTQKLGLHALAWHEYQPHVICVLKNLIWVKRLVNALKYIPLLLDHNVWRLLSDILSKSWDKWSEGLLPQYPQETLHTKAWFACSCVTWVPTSLNLRTWKLNLSEAFGECPQIYSVTTWSRSDAWLFLRIVEGPVF